MLHYIPPYNILEDIFKIKEIKKYNKLYFAIDYKNALFRDLEYLNEHVPLELLYLIIEASINLPIYIKRYYLKRYNFSNIHFIFFTETGKSSYHTNIRNEYKSNRKSSDMLLRDNINKWETVIHHSIKMLETIINYLPNCSFYRGEYFEFDFIPHYLLGNILENNDMLVINSTDKDMYQTALQFPNCYIFEKIAKTTHSIEQKRIILNENNIISRFFKKDIEHNIKIKEYFCLFRAIVGDSGDGIIGVKGVGDVWALKFLFHCFENNLLRPMSDIRNDICCKHNSNFDIFINTLNPDNFKTKTFKNIISNVDLIKDNLRLMDFHIIAYKYLHESNKVTNYLEKIKNHEKINSLQEFISFLQRCKCTSPNSENVMNLEILYSEE